MKAKDRIAKYSAFAISFIAMKNANAEAIYFDIDPDTIINADGEHYYIDLNNDGILDFRFFKFIGSDSTYWGSNLYYSYYMHIAPQYPANYIVGVSAVIDPSYGGFTLYYPLALNSGNPISGVLNFQNNDFQILAGRKEIDNLAVVNRGFWYPHKEDGFIGVKFLDSTNCFHYGWIRCDIKGGGDTLIIKDFAYESKCDIGIAAGDMTGDTTLAVSNSNVLPASVYCYGNEVNIQLNAPIQNARVVITNIDGSIVYQKKLTDQSSQIQLDEPPGIYVVEITNGVDSFSKKIVIQ